MDVPPPHVLVGHSLGGAHTQRYAQRFPDVVAALLQLEPLHPDHDDHMSEHLKLAATNLADLELPELTDGLVALARAQFASGMFDAFPADLRERLIDRHTSLRSSATAARCPTCP